MLPMFIIPVKLALPSRLVLGPYSRNILTTMHSAWGLNNDDTPAGRRFLNAMTACLITSSLAGRCSSIVRMCAKGRFSELVKTLPHPTRVIPVVTKIKHDYKKSEVFPIILRAQAAEDTAAIVAEFPQALRLYTDGSVMPDIGC